MNSKLLNKYIRNECELAELEEVLRWFREKAGTADGKQIMRESWEQFQWREEPSDVDFERMLDRLHHQINLSDRTGEKGLKQPFQRLIIRQLMRAAAILFVPVLAVLLLSYLRGELLFQGGADAEWISIETPIGSKTQFNLPDGSIVWLNHGSSLKYPRRFRPGQREVELEGEAYFEVTSNPRKPFRVRSGQLQVVAVGTEFNVLAYPEDTTLEVTLVEGRVDIRQELRDGPHTLYQMQPDEHLIFQKRAQRLIPAKVSPDKYVAWRSNRLIFDNDTFDEVINRLSRWFNVDFTLEDPELSKYTYTATFSSETLPQILELMELATPIAYEIIPREQQPDGSYSKMKVLISQK
ncbi:FecR family protein [Flavilitoribacter nigricans]|uniref:Iron dicitrate transport regulator FecR n=1 Tax=Flavilitoribacter nigricans (strain ATCC 23147 / DSM 23189 / NBRC 102662 / NCIMB 1420 / SS-2) TaxID=1122177 RepID=A0A2D0NBQ9_FLAN2|nr:FecR domain-containing protein [Flavilitoribacter nigricans]PHN05934.1 iron dicitrate transport regulator FecR [Flavilitoribacter nigricans DSM 23189 = NBRC 102662]